MPEVCDLGFLLSDIDKIGISKGGDSICDQDIYYYQKLNQVSLTVFEIYIIKECSRVFNQFCNKYAGSKDSAPYQYKLTQEQRDEKDRELEKVEF